MTAVAISHVRSVREYSMSAIAGYCDTPGGDGSVCSTRPTSAPIYEERGRVSVGSGAALRCGVESVAAVVHTVSPLAMRTSTPDTRGVVLSESNVSFETNARSTGRPRWTVSGSTANVLADWYGSSATHV